MKFSKISISPQNWNVTVCQILNYWTSTVNLIVRFSKISISPQNWNVTVRQILNYWTSQLQRSFHKHTCPITAKASSPSIPLKRLFIWQNLFSFIVIVFRERRKARSFLKKVVMHVGSNTLWKYMNAAMPLNKLMNSAILLEQKIQQELQQKKGDHRYWDIPILEEIV